MDDVSSLLQVEFAARFLLNLAALLVLLRLIYYRNSPHKEVLGGFVLFGNGVFLVTALLHDVEMSMGFAFGLFAIFSMLRYRTESLTIRDMTYLFVLIALALMNSVSSLPLSELILVNGVLCCLAAVCESSMLAEKIEEKQVLYEKIDLIRPEKKEELYRDVQSRLGFVVVRIEVGDVDFLKDVAQLRVYYKPGQTVEQASTANEAYTSLKLTELGKQSEE